MKRAFQYVRISTSDQSNWSIDGQQETNLRFAQRNDIEIIETFIDDGYSAKNFDRPGWKRLMKSIKGTGIDFVIVTKYDRLIRNVAEGLSIIEQLERRHGVKILSVMENININPHSPMFFKMRADMLVNAEFERRVISDRSKFGVWNAKRNGRYIGQAPSGYRNERDSMNKPIIVIDDEQANAVIGIYQDYLNGYTHKQIGQRARAKGFKKRGHSAINRVLTNPVYVGRILVPAYGEHPETIVTGIHDPIIDPKVWEQVQHKMNGGRSFQRRIVDEEVPLRGYVCCPDCESPLTGGKSKGRSKYYHYYKCNNCTGHNHSVTKAHNQMSQILSKMELSEDRMEALRNKCMEKFNAALKVRTVKESFLQSEIEKLTIKLDSVEERYIEGKIADETYRKWHGIYQRDLFGKKLELQTLSEGNADLLEKFSQELPKLMHLNRIFAKAKAHKKVLLLRHLFGDMLFKTKTGYRTFFVNPIFEVNGLESSLLDVKQKRDSTEIIDQNPVSTPDGMSLELFVKFLQRIEIAA